VIGVPRASIDFGLDEQAMLLQGIKNDSCLSAQWIVQAAVGRAAESPRSEDAGT
jgi:hypothetical protein